EGHIPGKEQVPVITFSAAVMDSDRKIALEAGANDVINKPFDLEILHEKITKYSLTY
ncbi:MAG: response regulator, partial [Pedobacter sp.]